MLPHPQLLALLPAWGGVVPMHLLLMVTPPLGRPAAGAISAMHLTWLSVSRDATIGDLVMRSPLLRTYHQVIRSHPSSLVILSSLQDHMTRVASSVIPPLAGSRLVASSDTASESLSFDNCATGAR